MKSRSVLCSLLILPALFMVLVVPQPASAQANLVTLTFYMLTAPHAALGAPMQYQITLTNTGTTAVSVNSQVNLKEPNGTVVNLLNTNPTLQPGQVLGTPGTFLTSAFTSQIGNFTITGSTISNGVTIFSKSITLVVTAVPANGIYGSIGGRGPDTAAIGYTYDFSTVVANLGTTAMSLSTQVIMTLPDLTVTTLKPGQLTSFSPGVNVVNPITATTTQFTKITGSFTVTVNVLDSSGNILSTDAHAFTRTILPTGLFPPLFADSGNGGINVERTPPTLPPNCGVGVTDFNSGNSGAAVADYDQDGFEDIFIAGENGDSHLWHNNHGNATWTDNAATAGIPLTTAASVSGASFADIDNDGFPDLLLLGGPQAQLILLHNNKNGTFTDISSTAGLLEAVPQNNFSATWGDYDGDGFLDVYIAVHGDCAGKNAGDHLFHNNGNLTFTEVTSFLGNKATSAAKGLTAVFVDYNQDGRPDLYLGDDQGTLFGANVLWRNDGPDGSGGWIFTDVSSSSGAGVAMSDMGIAVGDYNRDGQFDLYLTNFAAVPNPTGNVLLQGSASGVFIQSQGDQQGGAHAKRATVPITAGGQAPSVTWGTAFYDFNNDGWEDIYLAGSGAGCTTPCSQVNTTLLVNLKGVFLDLGNFAALNGSAKAGIAPTAVFLDYNKDGFMDVLQAPTTGFGLNSGNIHLFTNTIGSNTNHWLQVKLVGTTSNKDAVGARLVASVAGATELRTVINGGTYQGNSTLIQQFGLGTATQVDSLTIFWPSGMVQTLTNLASNQRMTITEP